MNNVKTFSPLPDHSIAVFLAPFAPPLFYARERLLIVNPSPLSADSGGPRYIKPRDIIHNFSEVTHSNSTRKSRLFGRILCFIIRS
jgi:hypothetical protein